MQWHAKHGLVILGLEVIVWVVLTILGSTGILAAAFGWNGHVVAGSAELRDTLEAAFNEDGPSLVVVPIDYRENLKLTERLGAIGAVL